MSSSGECPSVYIVVGGVRRVLSRDRSSSCLGHYVDLRWHLARRVWSSVVSLSRLAAPQARSVEWLRSVESFWIRPSGLGEVGRRGHESWVRPV